MRRLPWDLAVLVWCLLIGVPAWAADSVKTVKGVLTGRVVGISPSKVELEQGLSIGLPGADSSQSKQTKDVPVNQIMTVFFENEPLDLKAAKTHVVNGRFTEALAALERVKEVKLREALKQDIQFYKAFCLARLALAGDGKIADAGRIMKAFVDANPESYHYYEAVEIIGDLLIGVRQYAQAEEYYARLEQAPWPDCQMRAGVAIGRALLAEGKHDEAIRTFERVLAVGASGDIADTQRALANLGKASVLLAIQKNNEAVKLVQQVLQEADSEDGQVQARAYNLLGAAHRQAGQTREALLAFLRVHLLYSNVPDADAEALANLADLWEQMHQIRRAEQARKTLEEQYGNSPWAQKGGT